MKDVTAILSMLHEGPERNSASRTFRARPVLEWTLRRLSMCGLLGSTAVLCWEDQLPRVAGIADAAEAYVLAKGPRMRLPEIESVAAARRWSDGWRGGLLGTCAFDLGFYGPWAAELAAKLQSAGVLLVDPASALVDPRLVDALLAHADAHPDQEICFAPAAPGLCGALIRPALIERLAAAKVHPGRLLHYLPDQLSREMIASDACLTVPTPVARTIHRFTLDSDRQIARIDQATRCLNGQLPQTEAEELVRRLQTGAWDDALPREVTLELNTRRRSRPIFGAAQQLQIDRPDLTLELAGALFGQIAPAEDMRLTLAGVGDPLLSTLFFDVLQSAAAAGVAAIHLETDLLLENDEDVARLARSDVDVVSVHLPAATEETYLAVMGVDGFRRVLSNIHLFVRERQRRGMGRPLLVPVFTKCRANLAEMEPWYDQWLRALNCAVIRSPSTFGGVVPDVAAAEMTPPGRRPCARLESRAAILSDGQVVSCEEDILGRQRLGDLRHEPLGKIWGSAHASLRNDHRNGKWEEHAQCAACSEWHRP